MIISTWLLRAAFVGVAVAASSCAEPPPEAAGRQTDAVLDQATEGTENALDVITEGADKAIDATRDGAAAAVDEATDVGEKTVDVTKDIAAAAERETRDALSTTGEAITDGWITMTVNARFVDEALLKASDIDVDTDDRVVTLEGTVRSAAAKVRAVAIARSTDGVSRVVDQLVVAVN